MWEAQHCSSLGNKVEDEEEKTVERDWRGPLSPPFLAMMSLLMAEIIYSWSSLVLRDL